MSAPAAAVGIALVLAPEFCTGDPVMSCKRYDSTDLYWWAMGILLVLAVGLFAVSRRRRALGDSA